MGLPIYDVWAGVWYVLYLRTKFDWLWSAAHRGLQEEMVYNGWQKAYVLQRSAGEESPACSKDVRAELSYAIPVFCGILGLMQNYSCRCWWPFLPHYFPASPRTLTLWARSSLAVKRTATPCCRACLHPHRVTTGITASPSSRRTGSFSLPVKPKRSNVIG